MMGAVTYGLGDLRDIASGAAVLASGGGGSYSDACSILDELAAMPGKVSIPVQDYDGSTNACVLAIMGSPDAAESLTLSTITRSVQNTVNVMQSSTGAALGAFIAVEIGPINSLVPLLGAMLYPGAVWVVDGDGAGRAVPQLQQTTFTGNSLLAPSPAALASDAVDAADVQSAVLGAATAAQVESLAGGVVAGFGGYSGIAMWPSNAGNGFALSGSYIPGTLAQARALGEFLRNATVPPPTRAVAEAVERITGRSSRAVVTNFYITSVTQSTNAASLDCGIVQLDNHPDPSQSTETHTIYAINESLLMYSSLSEKPDVIAPDSICYYSESTGQGFSNASGDLKPYYDASQKCSTGVPVSVLAVQAAPQLYGTAGVVASFAALLRSLGYAGAMPWPRLQRDA
jgi:uncharacterized protein